MVAMLSFIAQEVVDPVADAISMWQTLVAFIAPILIGLITGEQTRERVKKLIPVIVSVGTWGITYLGNTDLGAEILILIPVLWGGILMVYQFYSGIVALFRGSDASVNDVLAPNVALIK